MSYLELYKKRMGGSETSIHNVRETAAKNTANRNFVSAQGYFPARLHENDGESKNIDIIVRSGTSELQKYIMLRPDTTVETGAYISYNNKIYIVKEVNVDVMLPKADCYLCNQKLNFRGIEHPIPCYTNSTTYGSKGILDQDKFYELDSKTKIYIQRNIVTEKMYVGQRIMFANKYVYKITEMDDLVFPNLYIIVAQRDESMPMDDFENNLAWNAYETTGKEEVVEPSEIVGDEKFKLHESRTYTINRPVTWEIDDAAITTISNMTETSVELQGIKRGWVTLSATDSTGQSYEKDIMIC